MAVLVTSYHVLHSACADCRLLAVVASSHRTIAPIKHNLVINGCLIGFFQLRNLTSVAITNLSPTFTRLFLL